MVSADHRRVYCIALCTRSMTPDPVRARLQGSIDLGDGQAMLNREAGRHWAGMMA